ncbi:MAG: hypothetical protein MZV70_49745 [Desulfobacterales bacterium]|nr:hypothetical protein [Desulfobacterales bacterium]
MGLAVTFVLTCSNVLISATAQDHPAQGAHRGLHRGHRDLRHAWSNW